MRLEIIGHSRGFIGRQLLELAIFMIAEVPCYARACRYRVELVADAPRYKVPAGQTKGIVLALAMKTNFLRTIY
jgi:hypothetical protein